MADTKVSALTVLTRAQVDAAADFLYVVDGTGPSSKKVAVDQLPVVLDQTLEDGEYTGITRTLVAFNNIGIGELVMYKLDTTLKFQLADVSEDLAAVGIAVETKTAGNTIKVLMPGGRLRTTGLPTLNEGAPVYRHGTTNGLVSVSAPTSGQKLQMIGYGDVDGDTIYFNPSMDVSTVA